MFRHICREWYFKWVFKRIFKRFFDAIESPPRAVADPDGNVFRQKVWLTLKENVKFGETVT